MRVIDLQPNGLIAYADIDRLQREVHTQVSTGQSPPCLIFSELHPVYTAGKRTGKADLLNPSLDVTPADRGGRITWHGPGQLVGYPIVRLKSPIDVVNYVRALETAVIDTLTKIGLNPQRRVGRSGVWLDSPDRKICAIGVRVAQGTTLHGLALNVTNSLDPYRQIVPCGISDAGVTSLAREGVNISVAEVIEMIVPQLIAQLHPLSEIALPKEIG